MSNWVDFRKLREQLDFIQVLTYYRIPFKRRGSQAVAACPLPGHPQEHGKPAQSFSVSLEKNIFQCFSCQAKGNVLDFISLMQGLDPHNVQAFREAALFAQITFGLDRPQRPGSVQQQRMASAPISQAQRKSVASWEPKLKVEAVAPSANVEPEEAGPKVLVNAPLDFALKNLDTRPAYLLNRGFTEATIDHFGLGYCTKGTFAGRIVIPLHDLQGRLIGYAGRLVFDEAIDEQNPKYLFPARRERNGIVLEFAKSLILYHGHAMTENPVHDLYIVQGFPAAWWLWQHVVALMGSSCCVDQAKTVLSLTATTGRIWCFTDADNNGEKCAQSLFREVGKQRFCKWVRPRLGQVTDCDQEQFDELLEFKIDK